MKLDILTICGSLRAGSYNKMLARALPALVPSGMTLHDAPPFDRFPLYNADLQEKGFPLEVVTFGNAVRDADGVIVISPEYNFSIPGGLKNALDWVSRLEDQPFKGKPVALQSASPGPLGGGRVQYDLRKTMVFLDALVLNKPEVFVANVSDKVDEDKRELTDETSKKFMREQLAAFAKFIQQVRGERTVVPLRKRA